MPALPGIFRGVDPRLGEGGATEKAGSSASQLECLDIMDKPLDCNISVTSGERDRGGAGAPRTLNERATERAVPPPTTEALPWGSYSRCSIDLFPAKLRGVRSFLFCCRATHQ